MTNHGFTTFHIVDESPWPLYLSLGVFALMSSILELISFLPVGLENISVVISFSFLSLYGWTRDISHEGAYIGSHTLLVQLGLKLGFVLFVLSEVIFFASLFWALFYFIPSSSVEVGGWPPVGVLSINPLGVPLLGTALLISSGISLTWGHHEMLKGEKNHSIWALLVTIILGLSFTVLQTIEYIESPFTIGDSIYGSIFFIITGFHGLHVLVGSIFLIICLNRIFLNQLSNAHHVGFEIAIWYWHFVDVVWLALYICLYW